MLNFKEYQERAYTAINQHYSVREEYCNWAVGLAEEAGEVLGVIKHALWGGEALNQEELAKELGDVLWYTAALATSCGLNLEAIADLNISKLEHRFGHSSEFSAERSAQRHQAEQKFADTDKYRSICEKLFQTPHVTLISEEDK